jgi:hypothetical protein
MKTTQLALPLPDASALCTRTAAAARLGVDPSTIRRWIKGGLLTELHPRSAPNERAPILLACAQVDAFAEARAVVKGRA